MYQLSKPIKGAEAHQLGLVDSLVSADDLVNTARRWALDICELKRPWIKSLYKTDKLEPLGEAREILKFARAQARRQAANLEHPLVCIDVIEEGIVSGPRAGLWKVLDATCVIPSLFTYFRDVHSLYAIHFPNANAGSKCFPGSSFRGYM